MCTLCIERLFCIGKWSKLPHKRQRKRDSDGLHGVVVNDIIVV